MDDAAFEKMGVFYLGKRWDPASQSVTSDYLLYDAKDLTTHAVCVGMTGSGKTGLCVALLEEAGIDGIPAIVVDPKGDLGNLLLTFPELRGADFEPWVDRAQAERQERSTAEYAEQVADRWRSGLGQWQQDGARIARFRRSVDLAIYTPGSTAGLPLSVLRSFAAPPPILLDDADAFRDRVASAAAGLLTLLGVNVDPVRSREFILISHLLDHAWRAGRDVDLGGLIRAIQVPPFAQIGVLDVDSFYPPKDRQSLALTLNGLLASPAFAAWLEGEPLDIQGLLYTASGQPRISILSIAHLSDAERMFFVTLLLNELLTWTRSQEGTSSLRAVFYMDEIFGYFPPVANPPSKQPMLTLLKQARAFGLGLVLATQNPVDLDYRGLSNCGSWFIGRLQTSQDKARVLDGLQSAVAQSGGGGDRPTLDAMLSSLSGRTFLMRNVHEDEPVLFQTRWVLSYLRGPLTREQIRRLTPQRRPLPAAAPDATPDTTRAVEPQTLTTVPSVNDIPAAVNRGYLAVRRVRPADAQLLYRPVLLGTAQLHFVRAGYEVDHWEQRFLLRLVSPDLPPQPWDDAVVVRTTWQFQAEPEGEAQYEPLIPELNSATSYPRWQRELAESLYRTQTLEILHCAPFKAYSRPGEGETAFRLRLAQHAREQRDAEVEKLRERHAAKLQQLSERIRAAQERVDRQQTQLQRQSADTVISVGASLLGALLGRKKLSRANVQRAGTAARRAGRVAGGRDDLKQAQENLAALLRQYRDLEQRVESEIARVGSGWHADQLPVTPLAVRPRKADLAVEPVAFAWTPWFVDPSGHATPAY